MLQVYLVRDDRRAICSVIRVGRRLRARWQQPGRTRFLEPAMDQAVTRGPLTPTAALAAVNPGLEEMLSKGAIRERRLVLAGGRDRLQRVEGERILASDGGRTLGRACGRTCGPARSDN